MQWSYSMLEERVRSYQNRYPTPTAKVVLHLLWWNLRQLLRKSKDTPAQAKSAAVQTTSPQAKLNLLPDVLNVGFLVSGGMGDFIIIANYLYKFRQKYQHIPMRLDVFARSKFYFNACFIFDNKETVDHVYKEEPYTEFFRSYDLFVNITRYPDIKRRNTDRLAAMAPEVLEYVFASERFREEHKRFYKYPRITDGQADMLFLLEGKTRIQQPDVYGFLGVAKYCEYSAMTQGGESAEKEYLNSVGLWGRPFITLHRGADTTKISNLTKLWPTGYYGVLIRLIKKNFPHIATVQLGVSRDRCPEMKGVDLNLVGLTSMEQVKILLKHSLLHIEGDGGFVYLRHALHAGPSAVLFGPTNPEFFGCPENVNLRGSGCKACCEYVTHDWLERCLHGSTLPPCMASLTPEYVFKRISPLLKENASAMRQSISAQDGVQPA